MLQQVVGSSSISSSKQKATRVYLGLFLFKFYVESYVDKTSAILYNYIVKNNLEVYYGLM